MDQLPRIGITMGDFNGIGPEVVMKALANAQLNTFCTPIFYGSTKVVAQYKHLLNMPDWRYFSIPKADMANPKQINLINCIPTEHEVTAGTPTAISGKGAALALERAVSDLKNGQIQAIVTAPIDKANIQSETFKFPGHTEYFGHEFNGKPLMFMVADDLRIGVVTGHVALQNIKISKEAIIATTNAMIQSLKVDFGITKPKIAVLGLNPHAGDGGLLGTEEKEIIKPAIDELKAKGNIVIGPFPTDGFFAAKQYKQYDAILAMYHDQGLTPFKMLAFEQGVNFTAGLSVVRTSPDHGTAYDIAGKGLADESSMIHAIFTAIDIYATRTENIDLKKNALAKKIHLETERN